MQKDESVITHTALGIAGLVQPHVECWSGEPGPQCLSLHTAVHSQLIPLDPFRSQRSVPVFLFQILSGLRGCCKAPALSATLLSSERQCWEADSVCDLLKTRSGLERGRWRPGLRGRGAPCDREGAGVILKCVASLGLEVVCKRPRAESPGTQADARPRLPREKHCFSSVLSSSLNTRPVVSRSRMDSSRDFGEGPCRLTGFNPNLGLDLPCGSRELKCRGGNCTSMFRVLELGPALLCSTDSWRTVSANSCLKHCPKTVFLWGSAKTKIGFRVSKGQVTVVSLIIVAYF